MDAALSALRPRLEAEMGQHFNSLLLNLYRHGRDSMRLHADREPSWGPEPFIASLSLGATRRFVLESTVLHVSGSASVRTYSTRVLTLPAEKTTMAC